jgi:hypothetical protein
MDKLDKFILKHFGNLTLAITFTIIFTSLIIFGIKDELKINWIPTIVCCTLLLFDWIYLIRCWIKFEHKS